MSVIHFKNLNGLRFIAAISVVIFHYLGPGLVVINGTLGVTLFFALSGFLITHLLLEEKEKTNSIAIGKFYMRRILRIWPLYYFVIIICIVVASLYGLGNPAVQHSVKNILLHVFFLPNLSFALSHNLELGGQLWSIGVEEQFYLFWPFIILFLNKRFLPAVFFIIIVFFALLPTALESMQYRMDFLSPDTGLLLVKLAKHSPFNCMATGALMAYLFRYKKQYLGFLYNNYVQIGYTLYLVVIWGLNINFGRFNEQVYATLFSLVIFNAATNPKCFFSLENKYFDYLGKLSFGIYMYHPICFFFMNKFVKGTLGIEEFSQPHRYFVFLAIAITVLVAHLSYKYFEKPILAIKDRKYTVIASR